LSVDSFQLSARAGERRHVATPIVYQVTQIVTDEHSAAFGRNPTVRRYGVVPVSDGALFFTAPLGTPSFARSASCGGHSGQSEPQSSAQKKAAPHPLGTRADRATRGGRKGSALDVHGAPPTIPSAYPKAASRGTGGKNDTRLSGAALSPSTWTTASADPPSLRYGGQGRLGTARAAASLWLRAMRVIKEIVSC